MAGDFGEPVVNASTAYNPMQAVQTLSSVVGLKQQQQALATGQYAQASAKAKATSDQIDANKSQIAFNEQQALGKLDHAKYVGPNNVFDADAYAKDALAAAPMSGLGQQRAQQMYEVRNAQLGVQSSAQKLNVEQRQDVTNNLRIAAETAKDPVDLVKFVEDQKKVNPGAAPVWDSVMSTIKPDDSMQVIKSKLHTLNFAVKGVDTPTVGTQYDKSGNLAGTTQSPVSGAIRPAGGDGVAVGLSPTDQPGYRATVARQTGLASGEVDIDTKRASEVSNAAQNSQGQIAFTRQADQLYDAINSGKFPSFSAQVMKDAGSTDPSVVARYELKKVLGTLKDTATSHAGSDAQLKTQLEQFPDDTAPAEVGHSRMDSMRGIYRLAQERKDNLNAYQDKHGLGGFQKSDDIMTSSRSPLIAELHALPKGSDARRAFLKRNFRGDTNAMQDAIEHEQASYHTVGNASGQ